MNMKVKQMLQVYNFRLLRKFCTKPKVRVEVEIEPAVEEALSSGAIRSKHSPGNMKQKVRDLPQPLLESITTILKGCPNRKSLVLDSGRLANQLKGRLPPPEERAIALRTAYEQSVLEQNRPCSLSDLNENDRTKLLAAEENALTQRMKQVIHKWKPMDYTKQTCLQYLIARTPQEYVVLHKIFSEIAVRDHKFKPSTFFDFGSGVGSGYWAAKEVWQKNFTEVFNVDSNVHMNDLAALLLRGGNKQATLAPGIFYRQFLPALPDPTYDIVLCAYTLLDLPSLRHRIETLLTLWAKTDKYLIIVEQGTNAGYQMVMEARDVILRKELKKSAEGDENARDVHVFAPCPHDMSCPRFSTDKTPCNFIVKYTSSINSSSTVKSELYSFVVLRKGRRPQDDYQWPRCVRGTKLYKGYVQCTLCKSDGELSTVTITKNKHSRAAYAFAGSSEWGDLLPGQVFVKTVEGGKLAGDCKDDDAESDEDRDGDKTASVEIENSKP